MYMHNYNSYHMTTKSNATPKMPWIPDLEVNARISTETVYKSMEHIFDQSL